MAVYVDDASIPADVRNGARVHSSQWSHLTADTQEELHEFAARLGLKRSYFQPGRPLGGKPSPFWHYDVTAGKRAQAIALGAQPVSAREMPAICRARSQPQPAAPAAAPAASTGRRTEASARSRPRCGGVICDAGQADQLAGRAWRQGDTATALDYLQIARLLAPGQAQLWDERERQVRASMAPAPRPRSCDHPASDCGEPGRPYPQGWRCDQHRPQAAYSFRPAATASLPVPGDKCPGCGTATLAHGRDICQGCGVVAAVAVQRQAEAGS